MVDVSTPPAEEEVRYTYDPETRYHYNPVGKRDPFASYLSSAAARSYGCERLVQCFDAQDMKLVGIVQGEIPHVVLQAPDRSRHVVHLGTYVGKNWGKVYQIREDEVVILEEFYHPGVETIVTQYVVLKLPESERNRVW